VPWILTPSVARNPNIPQTSYKCSKHRKARIAYNFTTLRSGPDEPAKLVEEGIVVREVLPIGPGLCGSLLANSRELQTGEVRRTHLRSNRSIVLEVYSTSSAPARPLRLPRSAVVHGSLAKSVSSFGTLMTVMMPRHQTQREPPQIHLLGTRAGSPLRNSSGTIKLLASLSGRSRSHAPTNPDVRSSSTERAD